MNQNCNKACNGCYYHYKGREDATYTINVRSSGGMMQHFEKEVYKKKS